MPSYAYSNANDYDEYIMEANDIYEAFSKLGLEKRFVPRSIVVTDKNGIRKTAWLVYDTQTGKSYRNLKDAITVAKAIAKDFSKFGRSRSKNVDPNAAPVTVSKRGDPLAYTNDSYTKKNEANTKRLREEYSKKISAFNRQKSYNLLVLSENTSSTEIYVNLTNDRGTYRSTPFVTFENAVKYCNSDVIFVNGKPWDRTVYSYSQTSKKTQGNIKHSDDLDAKDYICHALSDDYFTSMTVDEFRDFFNP